MLMKKFINFIKYINIHDFLLFWKGLLKNRKVIRQLIIDDFKREFIGTFFGVFWAFIQPLIFILVLWLVFATGLRGSRGTEPVPFVLWLMTGMFLWFFIQVTVQSSTLVITSRSFLVKKVKFQVSVLPIVKVLSAMIVHCIFIFLLVLLFILHGIWPSFYWLQIIYYLIATIILIVGISWLTSALNVFVKDIGPFVSILIRIGFWVTPVFWKIDALPAKIHIFFKLNPAYYLVKGYRNSFIYKVGFWESPLWTLYYWGVTLTVFVIGAVVFKRLRPHFADVL